MFNRAPKYIKEICPYCHPSSYEKTLVEFTGRIEEVALINDDGSKEFENEYLYQCVKCGTKMWVDEQWMKSNVAEVEEAIEKVKASRPHWSNEYLVWGFKTLIVESNFIRLRELFNEDVALFAEILNELSNN